ncbi:hypothetical protein F4820DRAFT_452163 [Hypoxylon rubiginosum]|uniref:Uncharacterized protein n=1 Tax=Hypoxylon rubiginosum TaxID=110542 RepID=A0ACB9YPY2_9PEZI|nr:hypothetical protein F4820DRAFT_452163 [Hypoxylon rubiginosum]
MMVSQDYSNMLPESYEFNNDFVPQLPSLPQTARPFDLAINPYSQSFSFNGPFPSPMTPNYPIDPRMFPTSSSGSGGSVFTPQEPTFNRSETGMIRQTSQTIPFTPQERTFNRSETGMIRQTSQAIPFTPQGTVGYRMGYGSFPDTPDTSPSFQQEGETNHYQVSNIVTKKVCEIENISSAEETPLIKRRTRARETCNNCRKEHRACDSKKPRCSRCEVYSKGSCCYDRIPKRRGRKPRPTKPLPDHILGAVIRSNPQLEYAIINELQNGIQPDTDLKNCEYLEQDSVRPALMDSFKSSAVYKLIYGDEDEKAEVSASATIFGAHLDQDYSPSSI